jgi:hypothetical protein
LITIEIRGRVEIQEDVERFHFDRTGSYIGLNLI